MPWVPDSAEPPHGWVLKREFSDAVRHVYVPNQPLSDNEEAITKEKKHVQRFIQKVRCEGGLSNFRWLAQEYVPTLNLGELRFMCIEGKPWRVVITGRNPEDGSNSFWTTESIRTMLSLDKIR